MEGVRPFCSFNLKIEHTISQVNLTNAFGTYYKLHITLQCNLYSHLSL